LDSVGHTGEHTGHYQVAVCKPRWSATVAGIWSNTLFTTTPMYKDSGRERGCVTIHNHADAHRGKERGRVAYGRAMSVGSPSALPVDAAPVQKKTPAGVATKNPAMVDMCWTSSA
jgi:hypothetical protein